MLILSGIIITMTIGENGIISKAKLAGKNYIAAQNYEQNQLAKIENSINNTRENDNTYSSPEGSKLKLLTKISHSTSSQGTYDITNFTKIPTDEVDNYLEYDTTNNYYRIKKSGWYTFIMRVSAFGSVNGKYMYTASTLFINNTNITSVSGNSINGTADNDSSSLTVYLSANDNFYLKKQVTGDCSATMDTSTNVFVMDK